MTAPLIGLTTRNLPHPTYNWPMVASPKSYTEALIRADALPALIPLNMPADLLPDLLARFDGIIFTGGGDIQTERFNGRPHDKVYGVDLERDAIELALVGTAPDGLAEAVVLPEHPFGIAVQWHPEWMPEDETQQKLFTAFRQAAADYAARKETR